jgi:mannan endo-1,4-beta-mannosidase
MPDLIGFDLGGIELNASRNLDSVPFSRMLKECRRQFARGGKVTLSWHARNPLTGGNSWDTTPCLAQVIDPDTEVHDTMQAWIERAGAFVAQVAELQTAPDQLIVRLWHEQSGNWFWWGREAGSADDYIALWQWTRNYMNILGINALYAYSPDKLTLYEDTPEGAYRETAEWYPGDEYVDIIGTDCYHHGGAEGTDDYLYRAHRQLDAAARLATEHHKRLAFTETGCEALRCHNWYTTVLLPLLRQYPAIEYVLVWRNAWDIPEHYYVPQAGTPEAEDLRQFLKQL